MMRRTLCSCTNWNIIPNLSTGLNQNLYLYVECFIHYWLQRHSNQLSVKFFGRLKVLPCSDNRETDIIHKSVIHVEAAGLPESTQ